MVKYINYKIAKAAVLFQKKKIIFKKVSALLLNGNQMCKCDRNVQAPCKIRAGLNYST